MPSPDTLIIGAGLAGMSVAAHLAPHERVVVMEMGSQPGAEATSDNAGMVRRMGEDPWERALAIRTHEILAGEGGDLSRVTGALLALVRDPHHLHDAAAHLRARGVPVEACDRPDEVAPAMAGARFGHAWWLPEERVADPHALLTWFAARAKSHGAEVVCNAVAEALVVEGGRVIGVRVDGALREAGRVVLAAGAWSARLAATAGLSRPLTALRRTLLQSDAHGLSTPHHPWCWVDDVGLYIRPEAGGWLCSPCDEAVVIADGPGSRGPVDALHRALAHDKLDRLMPAVADLRFVGGWTGLRTFAPDRRPMLGTDHEVDGLWWAAGLGGFGVTCSAAVGECVAAWMTGAEVPWLTAPGVSSGRGLLKRWPIRPGGDLWDTEMVR